MVMYVRSVSRRGWVIKEVVVMVLGLEEEEVWRGWRKELTAGGDREKEGLG